MKEDKTQYKIRVASLVYMYVAIQNFLEKR